MKSMTRILIVISAILLTMPICPALAGQRVLLKDNAGRTLKASQLNSANIDKTCGPCHDINQKSRTLHYNKGINNLNPELSECLSCHLAKTAAFDSKGAIKEVMVKPSDENCNQCHPDIARQLSSSLHRKKDRSPGDHPTCTACHQGYPHSHKSGQQRRVDADTCSKCHSNSERMKRYSINTNAVSSYKRSYHGKAFLHFGKTNAATCVDCHGSHAVFAPDDKSSPMSNSNVSQTCVKCHPEVKSNFYAAGANHLQVEMDSSIFLRAEDIFFKSLTVAIMLGLVAIVSLDLRKKVFCKSCKPRSGRIAAALIAISFYSLVLGIGLSAYVPTFAKWAWITWAVSLTLAFIAYANRTKKSPKNKSYRFYERLTLTQRLQHMLLASSFTILTLTGLPLRFADVCWTGNINMLFGGFEGARIAHRIGAGMLILTFVWHVLYLLLSWRKAGYSSKSLTMLPRKKDFIDFLDTLRSNTHPPSFDRFSFREKFDYFAVFWGLPIMVVSGLVLAFPFMIGCHLPPIALAAALIAHSDEALLAMLAIIVWHFYNVHLDPDNFPANNVWLTGKLSEVDMEREHPLEKARIDSKEDSKQA